MLLSFSKFSSVRYSKESALQHLLDGVKKHCDKKIKECERITCNMRIAGVQYASCFFATRILFFRLFHAQINVYDFYMNSRFNTKISSSFCHFQ